jgi:two-component system CheB/CheR fusion protein
VTIPGSDDTPRQDLDQAIAEVGPPYAGNDEDTSPQSGDTNASPYSFPVVAIGASAGGIEALSRFFRNLELPTEAAFVVVQHLSPDHRSILRDVIARHATIPFEEVQEGMHLVPQHGYVIPPNRTLSVFNGVFHLLEPVEPRYQRRPIDLFFRSLADDAGERAVGVILSGAGSDGTLGMKAIKQAGGVLLAQKPESADYDGMPRSIVDTGLVDVIDAPEALPGKLVHLLQSDGRPMRQRVRQGQLDADEALNKILMLVRHQTGHDFQLYKPSTLMRRIERRLAVHHIDKEGDYVRLLQQDPAEAETLFHDFLIRVSSFFRDGDAFEALATKALRRLIVEADSRAAPSDDAGVRIWVPGCSTGEEAYSVAMLACERMAVLSRPVPVQIFATDIDSDALAVARSGAYSDNIVVDVSEERLGRFFSHSGDGYRVGQSLRNMVMFANHSLTKDPPFSRMDLVCCRNVLIYMGAKLQSDVLGLLHYALVDNGYLMLGLSEGVGTAEDLFATVDQKAKLYQRRSGSKERIARLPSPANPATRATAPRGAGPTPPAPARPAKRDIVRQTIARHWGPSAVLIDGQDNIIYYHGNCRDFLRTPEGEATHNLLRVALPELRQELATALMQSKRENSMVTRAPLTIARNELPMELEVSVVPVDADAGAGMRLVAFSMSRSQEPGGAVGDGEAASQDQSSALERELEEAREVLYHTVEELQASNEELQSYNEELQSSNEELQISNEELDTSREELQSVNEELETVNAELSEKNETLSELYADMNNLLAATDVGMVVLDEQLTVKRFTPAAVASIPLISSDVGRPITDISHYLDYPELDADVRRVIAHRAHQDRHVQHRDGRWLSVRLTPYRSASDRVRGALLTLVDVTRERDNAEQLRKFARAIEQSLQIVIISDVNGVIEYVNPRFTELMGYTSEEAVGRNPRFLQADNLSAADWQGMWNCFLAGKSWQAMLRNRRKDGSRCWDQALITPITDDAGRVTHLLAVEEDVTARFRAQIGMQRAQTIFEALSRSLRQLVVSRVSDERTLVSDICATLVEVGSYKAVWVGDQHHSKGWMRPLAAAGVDWDQLGEHCLGDDAFERTIIQNALASQQIQCAVGPTPTNDDGTGRQALIHCSGLRFLAVPFASGSSTAGTLNLYFTDAELFDDSESELLYKLAGQIAWGLTWLRNGGPIQEEKPADV